MRLLLVRCDVATLSNITQYCFKELLWPVSHSTRPQTAVLSLYKTASWSCRIIRLSHLLKVTAPGRIFGEPPFVFWMPLLREPIPGKRKFTGWKYTPGKKLTACLTPGCPMKPSMPAKIIWYLSKVR